ncbi:MAG: hypothetical protein JXA64_11865 [Candidatus Fermentibacteraceae bacterium]|nr:hypothetical protein [Candidatus Fermentibacteraceae bacterium]MBN2609795.1 hypothetical protein [Candidatus Fermentibacteraceae bacterium]
MKTHWILLFPVLLMLLPGCDDNTYPFDIVTDPFTFIYDLQESGSVDVLVLNCYVVTVRTLLSDSSQSAGSHSLQWDLLDAEGQRVPDGLYYIRIILNDELIDTQMYEVHQ